jgi:MFS family permease
MFDICNPKAGYLHPFSSLITLYSFSLFVPTIINELGFTAHAAQLLSVPPYIIACAATVLVGMTSDRFNRRGPFIVGFSCISFIGYLILYLTTNPGLSYFGAILCATGVFPTIPITIIWSGGSFGGEVSRGA